MSQHEHTVQIDTEKSDDSVVYLYSLLQYRYLLTSIRAKYSIVLALTWLLETLQIMEWTLASVAC